MGHKNAVVTGASRGIGRSIVELFARNGINVWACASKTNLEFEDEMKKLEEEFHVWLKPLYFDLKEENEIKQAVYEIKKYKCSVDILVNNAGISKVANLAMLSMAQIREVFECNFFGPLYLTQCLQRMMYKNGGVILNIGSVSGLYPDKGYSAYGSSKAALLFLTQILAKELESYHIRVNAIAPGLIGTEMISYKSECLIQEIVDDTWLKRMGNPQEIANVVLFMVSDAASHISGEIIRVDGGRL